MGVLQGFVSLDLRLNGDGAFADIDPGRCVGGDGELVLGKIVRVVALDGGMASGLPSVSIMIELPDGKVAIGETTAKMLLLAMRAIAARYPALDLD